MKKKLVSIILSIMVAVTFMPLAADYTFATEGEQEPVVEQIDQETQPTEPTQPTKPTPPPQFNAKTKVSGIKVAGYTYKSVNLAWSSVKLAKGYQVYRATKKNGKYKLVKTVTAPSFNDTKNNNLSRYKYYKIRAYGTVNGKTAYGAYSGIFRAKPALPAAKNLKTTGGSGKITLSWSKVAGAKKYQVYRATSKTGKYKKLTTTKKCSYAKAATTGQRYYFKVRALRNKKKSGFSAIVEGLAAVPAPGTVKAAQSGEAIAISWSGVKQAYSYEVYRSEAAASGYKYIAGVKGTSFTDAKGLESGKTYFYRVRALASVNGKTQAGAFSRNIGGSRETVITIARSYKGIKEYSAKHKDIVNTFNSNTSSGKIGYSAPWCAAFVSAVEIKAGNKSLIPIGSYCPTMLTKFKNKTYSKTYKPNMADVIFFDWNANKVPDHVGFVDNYNSATNVVTTIEGNASDTVKCRTFTPGKYSMLLAYGLPNYPQDMGVKYTVAEKPEPAEEITAVAAAVPEAKVQEVVEEATVPEQLLMEEPDTEEPAVEEPAAETGEELAADEAAAVEEVPAVEETQPAEEPAAEAPETDLEKVEAVAEVVQEEQPAAAVEESTYDAFLVKGACEDMGIEACVVTIIDANGEMNSYNEITIDGQIYVLDASEGTTLEEYVPEEIN